MGAKGPIFARERSYSKIVAGIDEAGRGPWAGPVVAAAAIIRDPKKLPKGINDSKKLTPQMREELYEILITRCDYAVGIASVTEIDMFNILEATKLAMVRAYDGLSVKPGAVLIDGNRAPKINCEIKLVVGGDAKCLSIAAASIIAKVTRDRMMRALAREYPGYGWETNAGYGTGAHQEGLAQFGVTPHHRRSFAPIAALLEATSLFAA